MHLETSDFDITNSTLSAHLDIPVWDLSVPASSPGPSPAWVPAFPWDSLLDLQVRRVVWAPWGGVQMV